MGVCRWPVGLESGLFNWLVDWRTMYGLEEEVEVRIVGP